MSHILLERAFIFEEEEKNLDPEGCIYDFKKGAWVMIENGEPVFLVYSNNPNKPLAVTKKADVETGEDQKGM